MIFIDELYLSSEARKKYFQEEPDGVTDVIVKLNTGEKYIASFFTFQKIMDMKKDHKRSNQFLTGQYFWAMDMILVENCDKETITKVIEHLIDEGDFTNSFRNISKA